MKRVEWSLFLLAALSLVTGSIFLYFHLSLTAEWLWAIGGVAGLVPSILWVIESIRKRDYGADILAVLSLVGTLATKNMLAAAIISLMLATGRILESWASGHAERELKSLLSRVPRISHLISDVGSISDIIVSEIRQDHRLLIKSGEVVPVDGFLRTIATLDESALTGEPLPITRDTGELISSGVLNAGANFEMLAANDAASSTYAGIIRLVEKAQAESSPAVRMANRWAIRFIPIALLMGIGTLILTHDISRMVAVFVTATPCPLILAVPIAVVSGMSRAAKIGVVIKGGAVLEQLADAEVVMLDKTGTLTHGGPTVMDILSDPQTSPEEILQIAASIDQHSNHVIARAIVQAAVEREIPFVVASKVNEVHGVGVSASINGIPHEIGQFEISPPWLKKSYPLMVGVSKNGVLIGVIGMADPIRTEALEVLTKLRKANIRRTFLVTGDRLESAQEIAKQVGITDIHASVSSQGKLDLVEEVKRQTRGSVIFIGDGINDAPALAAATVGIAMGARGASAASESADVVIVEDSIGKLAEVIDIARVAHRKALQSAQVGMGLSLLAMIAAGMGFLTASVGAGIQELIDVIAILWALTTLKK